MLKGWKKIIIVESIILVIMILFPPFHVVYAPGVVIKKGYSFLLNPPLFQDRIIGTVDISSLLVQVSAALFLGVLYGLLFIRKKAK